MLLCNKHCTVYISGGVVLTDRIEEILIRLPKNLIHELNSLAKHEEKEINDFIHQAASSLVKHKKEILIVQEKMQKGYQEMAPINLMLCSEAFLAEEEANHTGNRSVIGV